MELLLQAMHGQRHERRRRHILPCELHGLWDHGQRFFMRYLRELWGSWNRRNRILWAALLCEPGMLDRTSVANAQTGKKGGGGSTGF